MGLTGCPHAERQTRTCGIRSRQVKEAGISAGSRDQSWFSGFAIVADYNFLDIKTAVAVAGGIYHPVVPFWIRRRGDQGTGLSGGRCEKT